MERPPSNPRSLCPLSSTEFVEPHPKKIPGVTPPAEKIPGYATDRMQCFSGQARIHCSNIIDIKTKSKFFWDVTNAANPLKSQRFGRFRDFVRITVLD
jgi:hypothetical protein